MTNSSNEADRESDDQPRLHFTPANQPQSDFLALKRRSIWFAGVALLMLACAAFLVIHAPSVHLVPPPLDTAVQTPAKPVFAPLNAQRKKIEEPLVRVNLTPGGVDSFRLEIRCRCSLISLEQRDVPVVDLMPGAITVTSTKPD